MELIPSDITSLFVGLLDKASTFSLSLVSKRFNEEINEKLSYEHVYISSENGYVNLTTFFLKELKFPLDSTVIHYMGRSGVKEFFSFVGKRIVFRREFAYGALRAGHLEIAKILEKRGYFKEGFVNYVTRAVISGNIQLIEYMESISKEPIDYHLVFGHSVFNKDNLHLYDYFVNRGIQLDTEHLIYFSCLYGNEASFLKFFPLNRSLNSLSLIIKYWRFNFIKLIPDLIPEEAQYLLNGTILSSPKDEVGIINYLLEKGAIITPNLIPVLCNQELLYLLKTVDKELLNSDCYKYIRSNKDLPVIEYLYSQEIPLPYNILEFFTERQLQTIFEFLWEKEPKSCKELARKVICNFSDIALVKKVVSYCEDCSFNSGILSSNFMTVDLVDFLLDYIVFEKDHIFCYTLNWLIKNKKFDVVKHLYKLGKIKWFKTSLVHAAKSKDEDFLRFVMENGCPISPSGKAEVARHFPDLCTLSIEKK